MVSIWLFHRDADQVMSKMALNGLRCSRGAGILFALLLCLPAYCSQQPDEDAHDLVATMVSNELKAQKIQSYWMYREINQEAGNTEVKIVLETRECWLTWFLSFNGKPVSPEQQNRQNRDLQRLVNDPNARRKSRAAIDEDAKKAIALLKILPDAFVFTRNGEQGDLIRVNFRPKPNFKPPSREAKVFHSMEGSLLIHARGKRLAKLNGRLTADVTFGGGILGRIYKGGTVEVGQTEVAPGDWELSLLDVHISGRALFFKTIREQQHQVKTHFRPVPPGLSLAQAAALLERQGRQMAAASQ